MAVCQSVREQAIRLALASADLPVMAIDRAEVPADISATVPAFQDVLRGLGDTAVGSVRRRRVGVSSSSPRLGVVPVVSGRPRPGSGYRDSMTTVNVNEVALGIESFGDDDAPLVLLAGGTTMLSWPDALCERLAAGGRRVVRYDLRDSGESTTADPEAPAYTLRDLAADAAALFDALGGAARAPRRGSASAGWSPRWQRSTHPARSRASPWSAPARSPPARPTMTSRP